MDASGEDEDGVSTAALSLEVELTSDPIRGSVSHERGRRRPFEGWMELTSAVEMALAENRVALGLASQEGGPQGEGRDG